MLADKLRRAQQQQASGPGYYSCTMTAGSFIGLITGYFTETFPVGAIDAEPFPFASLWGIADTAEGLSIGVNGDVVSLLVGLEPYIDGTQVHAGGQWRFDGSNTVYTTNGVDEPPDHGFVSSTSYFIEIKP